MWVTLSGVATVATVIGRKPIRRTVIAIESARTNRIENAPSESLIADPTLEESRREIALMETPEIGRRVALSETLPETVCAVRAAGRASAITQASSPNGARVSRRDRGDIDAIVYKTPRVRKTPSSGARPLAGTGLEVS